MSESKIQIKVGIVEFSGEGNEKWLAEQFDKMLKKVPELLKIEVSAAPLVDDVDPGKSATPKSSGSTSLNLSMISVAAKVNDNTGAGLATAAAAFLRFVKKQSTFTRLELLKNMKDATGYFEKNYTGNLTKILKQLVKNDILTQNADSKYSLHAKKENELNVLLSK